MPKLRIWTQCCLLVIIVAGAASVARSQDVFREIDQLKSEISSLKDEVNRLRGIVYELRESALKSAAPQEKAEPEKSRSEQEKATKKESPITDEELTKIICRGVGRFFKETDVALAAGPETSQEKMRNAFRKLNSLLKEHSDMHRVSKLLDIYQGLAWDTYVAVDLRESVQGNEEFLQVIEKHKRKYAETCPKE